MPLLLYYIIFHCSYTVGKCSIPCIALSEKVSQGIQVSHEYTLILNCCVGMVDHSASFYVNKNLLTENISLIAAQ